MSDSLVPSPAMLSPNRRSTDLCVMSKQSERGHGLKRVKVWNCATVTTDQESHFTPNQAGAPQAYKSFELTDASQRISSRSCRCRRVTLPKAERSLCNLQAQAKREESYWEVRKATPSMRRK
jgi:hypothetical protein